MKKILSLLLIVFLVSGCGLNETEKKEIECLKEIAESHCKTLDKLFYKTTTYGWNKVPTNFDCIDTERDIESSKRFLFITSDYEECEPKESCCSRNNETR